MSEDHMERISLDRPLPKPSEFAPPRARLTQNFADKIQEAFNKKPLTIIAESILDLRYTTMMQLDEELFKHWNSDEAFKLGNFAALLNKWAHETVGSKPASMDDLVSKIEDHSK